MKPRFEALAIGGSAGSLDVVQSMLKALTPGCGVAVTVCLHTSSDSRVCHYLARHTALPMIEAADGMPARAGRIYVAPGGYHLLMEKSRRFSLSVDDPVNYSRPSIDITFDTLAEAYRTRLIGVLVSGANADGARGLSRIHALGGTTLVQRPESATAPDMPGAALALFTPSLQTTPRGLMEAIARLIGCDA